MYSLTINNKNYDIIIKEISDDEVRAEVNGVEHIVSIRDIRHIVQKETQPVITKAPSAVQPVITPPPSASPAKGICSPIPGHILEIYVKVGDKVNCGQKLIVLEAMKLENIIKSDRDGQVKKILVREGDSVNHDQPLIIVE